MTKIAKAGYVASIGSACALFLGCSAAHSGHVAYQNSTITALLDGNYDGEVTFESLRRHGTFGLGTFDGLDGEMVATGGTFYQVRSDGCVSVVPGAAVTPFSVVTDFHPDAAVATRVVGPLSFAQLQRQLDEFRPTDRNGHAFAFKIDGRFARVRTRSVPRQSPPYRPLAQVVKEQAVFDLADVQGTLVGFWFPESMSAVNVPGYHFHFITRDRSAGGHVLDLTLSDATIQSEELDEVRIALPRRAPTTRPTPAADVRSREMHQVEK
jgi:acetolactate decarboxylase